MFHSFIRSSKFSRFVVPQRSWNSRMFVSLASETEHKRANQFFTRMTSGVEVGEPHRTSMVFKVNHRPGALEQVLKAFAGFNLTRIESRPCKLDPSKFQFFIDFEGDSAAPEVQKVLDDLKNMCEEIVISEPLEVIWFPRKLQDLDLFSQKTLAAGEDLESDHPGFHDKNYRDRRSKIIDAASTYKFGHQIPRVDYNESETKTWGAVYKRLKMLFEKYACKEYNQILPHLEMNCGYGENNIPQLEDVSNYLQSCTGFRLRPVSGLLTARDFLNALAFRTFFSTQYIRHHSKPLYTPEPDVVHELMGHAPLLANPDFAELSQQYGLASLGASDEDIARLATCYWFSVEFGLCREGNDIKAYGAGLLSSFGEMEYACNPNSDQIDDLTPAPKILPWDPKVAASTEYPITTYQPTYFLAESLKDATQKLKRFSENDIIRPFHVSYHALSRTVQCDRMVRRNPYPKD